MSGFLRSSVYVGFLVSCDCYVAIIRGAVGWSAVFDCGISWSYSFAFLHGWMLCLIGTTHTGMLM